MKTANNPSEKYPKPPFPSKRQAYPGSDAAMDPQADHGENSYVGYRRFENKTVLITGGDSGIGRAVAIAFAREGADLLISYLADSEDADAEETARYVREAGRKVVLFKGDIRDENICREMVKTTIDTFGKIDVLINNAAFQMSRKSLDDIPSDEWDRTFNTNIKAIFFLCKAALPHMLQGSCIINTTSITAYEPSDDLLAYSASKGAILNFTSNLSQILLKEGRGIRVNAVAPGPLLDTPDSIHEIRFRRFWRQYSHETAGATRRNSTCLFIFGLG